MISSVPTRSRTVVSLVGATALAALIAVPTTARADRRETLAEQPAVRNRLLLVAKRLEATAMFVSTTRVVSLVSMAAENTYSITRVASSTMPAQQQSEASVLGGEIVGGRS